MAEFLRNSHYQLALDAAETDIRLAALWRIASGREVKTISLEEYIYLFYQIQQSEDRMYPIRTSQDTMDNLQNGVPFPEDEVGALINEGLTYSPEGYRTFLNLFSYLFFQGQLHKEFRSPYFLMSGFYGYAYCGLIGQREMDHLPRTAYTLVHNLVPDLYTPDAFMKNKKLITEAQAATELPRSAIGRPRVLLHGRFNGFLGLNYLEAIFSTVTRFPEPPCFVIGIDPDLTSTKNEGQIPFMNQVFRAGFYTLDPLIDAAFLADQAAADDPNSYWGKVYADMELDYLVLEEQDPNFEQKKECLRESTNGKRQIIVHKSEYEGIPRLSTSSMKKGDPLALRQIDAKWRQLTLNLFAKYFSGPHPSNTTAIADWGTHKGLLQTPLFLVE